MKPKYLLVLLVVFVGLFAIVKGSELLKGNEGQAQVRTFLKVSASTYNKISIVQPSQTQVLQKSGNSWELTTPITYPVMQSAMDTVVSALANLQSDDIVSSNASKKATYGVDDQTGVKIILTQNNKEVAQFMLGNASTDGNHTYATLVNSNDIHAVRGNLRDSLVKDTSSWRDKTILALQSGNVSTAQFVHSAGDSFRLTADGQGNYSLDGNTKTVNVTKMSTLTSYVTTLLASAFVDDPATVKLSSTPDLRMVIATKDNNTINVSLWKVGTSYYAQKNGTGQLYQVDQTTYDGVNTSLTDLLSAATSTTTTP